MKGQASSPVPAVIAVTIQDEQVLLVRRANPPDAGLWGFPGGKIEYGETVAEAAIRELHEETTVAGEALNVLTSLDILDRSEDGVLRYHYILIAVRCRWLSGTPTAGDDALEAAWFSLDDLAGGGIALSADVERIARLAHASPVDDNGSNGKPDTCTPAPIASERSFIAQ